MTFRSANEMGRVHHLQITLASYVRADRHDCAHPMWIRSKRNVCLGNSIDDKNDFDSDVRWRPRSYDTALLHDCVTVSSFSTWLWWSAGEDFVRGDKPRSCDRDWHEWLKMEWSLVTADFLLICASRTLNLGSYPLWNRFFRQLEYEHWSSTSMSSKCGIGHLKKDCIDWD